MKRGGLDLVVAIEEEDGIVEAVGLVVLVDRLNDASPPATINEDAISPVKDGSCLDLVVAIEEEDGIVEAVGSQKKKRTNLNSPRCNLPLPSHCAPRSHSHSPRFSTSPCTACKHPVY